MDGLSELGTVPSTFTSSILSFPALLDVKSKNKPKVIIANTIKGKGVSFMENSVLWHYRSPNNDELEQALQEIEK